MSKQSFSGRNIVVTLGTIPIVLAKEDEAVIVENAEDDFGDPVVDLSGTEGAHVENSDGHGTVTVMVPPTATMCIRALELFRKAKVSAPFMTGRDITTQSKAFVCMTVVLKKPPRLAFGAKPANLEYVFSYITSEQTQDGPRDLPV